MRGVPLPLAVSNAALGKIVRRHLDRHRIAGQDADIVFAHFPRNVRGNDMTVFEFYSKHGVRQSLSDLTLHFDLFFFWHTSQ